MKPKRLQLARFKGFNLRWMSEQRNGLDVVKVDRSTKWGNPFRIVDRGNQMWAVERDGETFMTANTKHAAQSASVALFREYYRDEWDCTPLARKNLACWCKPGEPCHADVLLELANRPKCEAA